MRPLRAQLPIAALLIGLSFGSAPGLAHAQNAGDIEQDYQQWGQLYGEVQLDSVAKGLRLLLDLQSRRLNAPLYREAPPDYPEERFVESPNTIVLVRPALGYQITPWASVWLGYAWQPIFFDSAAQAARRNVQEHRIFQQFSTAHTLLEKLQFGTRTRVEQRVRTVGPGSPANDAGMSSWAHRARTLVRVALPLGEGPFRLVVWDEIFFHLNDTNYPTRKGFDQNRLFGGVGYQVDQLRIELGYLHQFMRRFTDAHQSNHVLFLSVIFALRG